MKLVSFFRLVRYPNLVFIVVTQFLFYFCILSPAIHPDVFLPGEFHLLSLLVLSSVCIAAGGYIINDYFDLKIDLYNKPKKVIVGRKITRRWAIVLHLVLSLVGILLGLYISWATKSPLVGLSNIVCVLVLWLYSTTFKKKLLSGNIIISLMTAWVVMIVFFFTDHYSPGIIPTLSAAPRGEAFHPKLIRITFLYAGFAFIVSLIREVIKDMEDMQGDARFGCKTMPIVWGIPVAKMFTGVWLMVIAGALLAIQFYAIYLGWWWSILYCTVFIIFPLIVITKRLYEADTVKDFGKLSGAVKFVMLTGILSMVFFKIYLT